MSNRPEQLWMSAELHCDPVMYKISIFSIFFQWGGKIGKWEKKFPHPGKNGKKKTAVFSIFSFFTFFPVGGKN